METSNTRRIGSYVSTTEVPDELRERATRMAVEARQDPQARVGAVKRIADQLGVGGFNWSSQHSDLGGMRRGQGRLEFEDQRCSRGVAAAVAY